VKIASLKSQKEFDNLSKSAFKRRGSCFLLIISKVFSPQEDNDSGQLFLGMKVSRKLSKKAVIRNKIKRRIRHIMRLILAEFRPSARGLIVIPYKGFDEADFAELHKGFKDCLR